MRTTKALIEGSIGQQIFVIWLDIKEDGFAGEYIGKCSRCRNTYSAFAASRMQDMEAYQDIVTQFGKAHEKGICPKYVWG